ncbi:FeoB-associated Cys-rich membrane protein [uncultured Faecalibaculum sp.]|uniref:FeoB-associated Cys-rich membrane protein n=1 Tax=uncultured Faecalibaculum sp. TaxID=1729681 RepID=UPI00345BDD8D
MILLVLTVVLVFIFRQMRKDRKKSCNGDCAHCHQVDWNEVRRELHKEKAGPSGECCSNHSQILRQRTADGVSGGQRKRHSPEE